MPRENPEEYKQLRSELVAEMWWRYCKLREPSERTRTMFERTNSEGRAQVLRYLLQCPPEGWRWGCALEQSLLGRDEVVDLKPAEPTKARPGSPEKVEELRRRAREGFELHSPQDATWA